MAKVLIVRGAHRRPVKEEAPVRRPRRRGGLRHAEYIRNDPDCQRIVRHFFERGRPVAQLCHGPLALAAAGVLRGRRTAAYPALAPDVRAAGAEFVDAEAVVDGTMVSARAWPDHPAWMREFIRLLRAEARTAR